MYCQLMDKQVVLVVTEVIHSLRGDTNIRKCTESINGIMRDTVCGLECDNLCLCNILMFEEEYGDNEELTY